LQLARRETRRRAGGIAPWRRSATGRGCTAI